MAFRSSAEKHIAQLIDEKAALHRVLEAKKLEELKFAVEASKLAKENNRLRGEMLKWKQRALE